MDNTIIIAEAGVNHNGDINLGKNLIDVAVEAKADYVKFQTFNADALVSVNAEKAEYQKIQTDNNESHHEMLKNLQLSREDHLELIRYCNIKKIKFLSTPFDIDSINFLSQFDLDYFKIPSGEINNYPYLKHIATFNKPIILSTGMSSLNDIEDAVGILIQNGVDKSSLSILHCNTEYPTPFNDVNLLAMLTIRDRFEVNVGYSDHTKGFEVSIAAVALGASIIEKHFTLDNKLPGPDHAASLEPAELKIMVKKIRNIEKSLGNGVKKPSLSEQKNISIARKSIIAKMEIKKGEVFSDKNITTKRPGQGLSPMKWNDVIGKVSRYDFQIDDFIKI